MTIKEQNTKELKKAWEQFLKRKADKNVKSGKQKTMLGDPKQKRNS